MTEYVSPEHVCAPEGPAVLFKSGTLVGDTLYACTQTELLTYELPDFRLVNHISLPQFNDVHHVRPTPTGNLLVVNTGLDMVMEVTELGEVVGEWSVVGKNLWHRFSRDTDYRRVASTKPYEAHPNYVFYVGDEIWVTRFQLRDAVCLSDPAKRIAIGIERVHDGIVQDGRIYFTTVDGKIVVADQGSLTVDAVIDLNELSPGNALLGWCRGIAIREEKIWVGFSRLRPTRFRENVSWAGKGFKRACPTHVACYDLENRRRLNFVELESHGLNTVFSVLPYNGFEPIGRNRRAW